MSNSNEVMILISLIIYLVIFNWVGNFMYSLEGEVTNQNYNLLDDDDIKTEEEGFLTSGINIIWGGISFLFEVLFWNFKTIPLIQIIFIQPARIGLYFILLRLIRGTG